MFNEIMDVTDGLSVFNDYQSACDEDRSSQCKEHWKNFTHVSNPNVHHKSQLPDSQYKGGKVFDQVSIHSAHHVYPIVEKTIQQSKNIKCLKQSSNGTEAMNIPPTTCFRPFTCLVADVERVVCYLPLGSSAYLWADL